MKFFIRNLRLLSSIVLFFFAWSFGPLFQIPAAIAGDKQGPGAGSQSPRKPATGYSAQPTTASSRFEKALETIRENINKADDKESKNQDITTEVAEVMKQRAEIDKIDGELKTEFAATEKKLKDANLPKEILNRHYNFVKHYEDNLRELKTNLLAVEQSAVSGNKKKEALTKTKTHLEKTKAPSHHQKLDPNNLPFRNRKEAKPIEPRLKKEQFEKDFPSKKNQRTRTAFSPQRSQRTAGLLDADQRGWMRIVDSALSRNASHLTPNPSRILLAYNGPTSDMPLQLPLPSGERTDVRGDFNVPVPDFAFSTNSELSTINLALASPSDSPTSGDLAETPEVIFTQDIKDFAGGLGNNPVSIYETIRNNFKYESYYGSLKGAQETLREKGGNDFDLASLLISLYRFAGIPARYVIATIQMPLSQAQSWLGMEDPHMVGRLLASAGVPVSIDYTSGKIRMEHVFVQAWVPYQNGRGALNGPGDNWVFIDPSFKETKVTQILSQDILPFDQRKYLAQLRAEDPAEYYTAFVQDNLSEIAPGRTTYAAARHCEIVPLAFGMFIGMPQYDVLATGGSFQEVPDQYRYKIGFEVDDPETLEPSLTYGATTADLAGKRITISYQPATSNDQLIISNYGDLYNVPAYLIKLRPELKIDGTTKAQGVPIGFGNSQPLIMKFTQPAIDSDFVVNDLSAGAYYAIAFDFQVVTQKMISERTKRIQDVNDYIATGGIATPDDHAGELLYATALTYFQKLDAANKITQELLKINDLRGVSEAMFSIDISSTYLLGIPISADVSGVHIDVDRDMHLPIPVMGNIDKIKEYNLLIGSNSSYFEHRIIEDIYPSSAISAVKGLQIAREQGIEIQTINQDNINAIMPSLQFRNEIKADIENAVNSGKEVVVPREEISVNDWSGAGYIVMNPQTGEAGYIISGGFAGGSSTSMPLFTWLKANALSGNVSILVALIEASQYDSYVYFPGPDGQLGTSDDPKFTILEGKFKGVWGPVPQKENFKGCDDGKVKNISIAPHLEATPVIDIAEKDPNLQLSKNIKLSEMMSNDNNEFARIAPAVVEMLELYLQQLSDVEIPLSDKKISVGYRTLYKNCDLAAKAPDPGKLPSPTSAHMDGLAADIDIDQSKLDINGDGTISDDERYLSGAIGCAMIGEKGHVRNKAYKGNYTHLDLLLESKVNRCT